jgi:hypothetical protein
MTLNMRHNLFFIVYLSYVKKIYKQFEIQNLRYVGSVVGLKQNAWKPLSTIKWISNTFIVMYTHINI